MFSEQKHSLKDAVLAPLSPHNAPVLAATMAQMEPWLTLGVTEAHFAQTFSHPALPGIRRFELLAGDGKLAGLVCLQEPWLSGPYLQILMIMPPFQRLGLGGQVLEWVEAQARGAGKRQLWLCVSAFNIKARNFYEKFGFRQAAVLDQLLCQSEDEILMRKRLF